MQRDKFAQEWGGAAFKAVVIARAGRSSKCAQSDAAVGDGKTRWNWRTSQNQVLVTPRGHFGPNRGRPKPNRGSLVSADSPLTCTPRQSVCSISAEFRRLMMIFVTCL